MYKAKPRLVIMYDSSNKGYAVGGGLNFARDFYYPALSQHFDLAFYDADLTYAANTVFLHDAYHEQSRLLIPQQLEQGHRVILHSPTERKTNPSPFEAGLAWAMMHPTQVYWILSGNDLRHWPEIQHCEVPFWFWLFEQYGETYLHYQPQSQADKKFLCLMNNPHRHRHYLWQQLDHHGLRDHGIVSFRGRGIVLEDEPPSPIDVWLDRVINTSWFDRTAISLVSETDVASDTGRTPWLTEKTTKCLMMQHPFLLQGQPGSLDLLHSFGFETFPELWDESYDLECDWQQRTQRLIHIVKNFDTNTVRDPQIQQKLCHNRELFWNRDVTAGWFEQSVIMPLLEWVNA